MLLQASAENNRQHNMTSEVERSTVGQQSYFDGIVPKAEHVLLPFKTNIDQWSTADFSHYRSAPVSKVFHLFSYTLAEIYNGITKGLF